MNEKSQRTVSELAKVIGIPVDRMLVQLKQSGLPYTAPEQPINEEDKRQLLSYLRNRHGTDNKKPLSLAGRRKVSVSELHVPSSGGRRKTITIEVRNRVPRGEPRGGAESIGGSPRYATAGDRQTEAKRALAEEARRQSEEHADALRVESEQTERELLLSKAEEAQRQKLKEQQQAKERAKPDSPTSAPESALSSEAESEALKAAPDSPAAQRREASPAATDSTTDSKTADKKPNKAAPKDKDVKAGNVKRGGEAKRAASGAAQPSAAKRSGDQRKATQGAAKPPTAKPQPAAKRSEGGGRKSTDRKARDGGSEGGGRRKGRQPARTELHIADKASERSRKRLRNRTLIANQPSLHGFEMPTAPVVREIVIPETIAVADLAQKASIKAPRLIRTMSNMGIMATLNQVIDQETAHLVVEELGHRAILIKQESIEEEITRIGEVDKRETALRAPVVTIMGHVDHGKTSLLDYIRQSKVASTEAGGITQRIGAYRVSTRCGPVTFLDTPGHAAFTAMRARGSKATDMIVLVVAADDGVMPQTVEAITHARAANVPMIVAVNKCDRANAEPQRMRQELIAHQVLPEEVGGDTMFVDISALTGDGVDALLESIALQAEMLELKAPDSGVASGVVLESRLDQGSGAIATVLVQKGQLLRGDMLLAGQAYGRVRRLYDENGADVDHAGPSTPVEVLGLSEPPQAGDEAIVVKDRRKVREVAAYRQSSQREARLAHQQATRFSNVFERLAEGRGTVSLNIIVKADSWGSIDALRDSLTQLSTDEVKIKIVSAAIGGISETDVNLALSSDAILIGFNVRADAPARKLMSAENVNPYYYSVIYHLIDAVKQVAAGKMTPKIEEQTLGVAEVLEVFRSKRLGNIAGCRVVDGIIKHQFPIRVLRDSVVIYDGELESLRRFQDNVNEVHVGTECGIGVRNYNDIKVGDQIEVFERVSVKRS